jgi:hypothetical protein
MSEVFLYSPQTLSRCSLFARQRGVVDLSIGVYPAEGGKTHAEKVCFI